MILMLFTLFLIKKNSKSDIFCYECLLQIQGSSDFLEGFRAFLLEKKRVELGNYFTKSSSTSEFVTLSWIGSTGDHQSILEYLDRATQLKKARIIKIQQSRLGVNRREMKLSDAEGSYSWQRRRHHIVNR
jgi:hypothetical protein